MSQKNSHWKRYVFNMLLCLTSFHIVKPSLSVFIGKFDFFDQKDEIEHIRQKSIREGAASSGLYFRTTFAHSCLTKTFQKSQKLLLSNFQYIFSEVLLISSSFILIFSKNWENLHICFKFHETMSVRNLETQQVTCSRSTDFTGMWVRLQLWHSF